MGLYGERARDRMGGGVDKTRGGRSRSEEGPPHIAGEDKIWAHSKPKIEDVDTQHALVLSGAG
jgi:hypothetical protein